jgi:hypothetical protein
MQRDMDLIRDILIHINDEPQLDGTHYAELKSDNFGSHSPQELSYHIDLLLEAGLVKGIAGSQVPLVSSLTWRGHEFLSDISDPGIWAKVKEQLAVVPNLAFATMWEIAKDELKKKLHLSS